MNILQFRGIKGLHLNDLGDINILVGANNCGKTSVLEAIKLLEYPDPLADMQSIAISRRGFGSISSLSLCFPTLFYHNQEDYNIELTANIKDYEYYLEAVGNKSYALDPVKNVQITKFSGSVRTKQDSDKPYDRLFDIYDNHPDSVIEIDDWKENFNAILTLSTVSLYHSCVEYLSQTIIEDKKADIMRVLKSFDTNIDLNPKN